MAAPRPRLPRHSRRHVRQLLPATGLSANPSFSSLWRSPTSTATPSTPPSRSATMSAFAGRFAGDRRRTASVGVVTTACYIARIRGLHSSHAHVSGAESTPRRRGGQPELRKICRGRARVVRTPCRELTPLVGAAADRRSVHGSFRHRAPHLAFPKLAPAKLLKRGSRTRSALRSRSACRVQRVPRQGRRSQKSRARLGNRRGQSLTLSPTNRRLIWGGARR